MPIMKRSPIVLALVIFVLLGTWVSLVRKGPGVVEAPEIAPWPRALGSMGAPNVAPGVLNGRILYGDGTTPCAEALVELVQGGRVRWAWTDKAGKFSLNGLQVTPKQPLVVLLAEHMPQHFQVAIDGVNPTQVTWTLGQPVEPINPLPEVSWGNLAGSLMRGMPGAWGNGSTEGFEVWLLPEPGSDPLLALGERRAAVQADGSFSIRGLLNGVYTARILPNWAHGGSWPILGEASLDFSDGRPPIPLEIPLVEGMVGGSLVDQGGLPISGALLMLRSSPNDQTLRQSARVWPPVRSGTDGSFVLVDLPPGDYEIELVAGDARLLRRVSVRAGSLETVGFGLISPRTQATEKDR
ncbi:MAG: hypothetical protein ACI8Q9_000049 [Planctomycetota bacterium]|jgi:hypothetical protein